MKQSKKLGVTTSFTFSDPFLVDRYRDEFLEIVPQFCDVLFCNADEARHLLGIDSLEECTRRLGTMAETVFVTDGPNGCMVSAGQQLLPVAGFKVHAIDTVGAGDAFAGGVLYGLAHNLGPTRAARWGNYMASEVVSKTGPRLNEPRHDRRDSILAV
jgi:sugar/nucleoside kinase (ribokinase family)